MSSSLDNPLIVFVASLIAQGLAALVGEFLRKRRQLQGEGEQKDFENIQTVTLTLLALIIGFSFSMAVTRYDQRKNYEEAEANAIGTEYLRADLLPAEDAARAREYLRKYVDQRVSFYLATDERQISQIDADTAKQQAGLWSVILQATTTQSTPVVALAVSGMNDVLNAQGYTQAAWWNRIPVGAWAMMVLMAMTSNLMLSYGRRREGVLLLLVFPVVVSISFLLIADIDSPRGGIIRVLPQNLNSLSQSISGQ